MCPAANQSSDGRLPVVVIVVVVVFEVWSAELPPHSGRRAEAPANGWWSRPQEDVRGRGQRSRAWQAVVVGSGLEWCIVGVVVGVVVLVLVVLVIVMETSVPVPASTSSSSPGPAPLPTWAGGQTPPLSGPPLVPAAAGMLPIGVGAIAVGGAVQGVAPLAALIVLVEAALVALLPTLVGTRGAHASRRRLKGEGQQGVFQRGRRRGGLRIGGAVSSFLPLLSLHSSFAETQGHQGGAGGAPGKPVGGVTLEGKFEFALLWGDEASSAGQVNGDHGRVWTCEVRRMANRK